MLTLPPDVRAFLETAASSAYPLEACGVLVGRSGHEVVRAVRAGNTQRERARDRYVLDPLDLLRADEDARSEGLDVVGIWHSHPDHPARPSETDRQAAWPGWSYLIASVGAAGVTELRAWRLDAQGQFVEEATR